MDEHDVTAAERLAEELAAAVASRGEDWRRAAELAAEYLKVRRQMRRAQADELAAAGRTTSAGQGVDLVAIFDDPDGSADGVVLSEWRFPAEAKLTRRDMAAAMIRMRIVLGSRHHYDFRFEARSERCATLMDGRLQVALDAVTAERHATAAARFAAAARAERTDRQRAELAAEIAADLHRSARSYRQRVIDRTLGRLLVPQRGRRDRRPRRTRAVNSTRCCRGSPRRADDPPEQPSQAAAARARYRRKVPA